MEAARVLVVGRPEDFRNRVFNGFVDRHSRLLRCLQQHFEVGLLLVHPPGKQDASIELDVPVLGEASLRPASVSRCQRLVTALADARDKLASFDIPGSVHAFAPTVAVTFGPWINRGYSPIFAQWPTVHFFEEDLSRMYELAPQSARARVFRATERTLTHWAQSQPRIVVFIALREGRAAVRLFPKSKPLYLPFTLDAAQWPISNEVSSGYYIATVGNFTERRNSSGLRAVLEEICRRGLERRLRVEVVSGPGLHPELSPYLETNVLSYRSVESDLGTHYRNAWAALVPAERVTGVKTTVLQAWSCRCPVVCSDTVAQTIGGASAVVAATDAGRMVDGLLMLAAQPAMRQRVADAGVKFLKVHHDEAAGEKVFLDAVRFAIESG